MSSVTCILWSEMITLKQRLNEAQVSAVKMREYLIRSLYIEMLGHDASFAYIHAVKLSHDKNLICKRTGYLTCSLCLDDKHELLLLLINTIQKVRVLIILSFALYCSVHGFMIIV